MKRTSKYLGKTFDNGWTCTHIGVASVQSKKKANGKKAKRPGHQSYYYCFERVTSDAKADKLIRLTSAEAAKVYRGEVKVEQLAKARTKKNVNKFTSKVSYHFFEAK